MEIPRQSGAIDLGDISKVLLNKGVIILEGLLSPAQIMELKQEVEKGFEGAPQLAGVVDQSKVKFFSPLPLIVPSSIQTIILNDTLFSIADEVLGPNCHNVRIHTTGGIQVLPGGAAQPLHRELDIFQPFFTRGPQDPQCILFSLWAIDDFYKENGATCLVPGSHRWPDGQEAQEEQIFYAEMPAGSVALWLGRTLHAGGANKTQSPRSGVAVSLSVDWLTQEENQFISVSPSVARTLPTRLQKLLGYRASPSYGWSAGYKSSNLLERATDPRESGPAEDIFNLMDELPTLLSKR